MVDLNDVELDRSGEAPVVTPLPKRSVTSTVWATAIIAALVVAGGIWYSASQQRAVVPSAVTASVPPATVPERPEVPLAQAAQIDLPPLPQTDPVVRELVARVSSHPTVAAWLATQGLLTNFTVVTLNIAEGRTPAKFLRSIAPRGPFRTMSARGAMFVDPRSYERYNPHGDAIAALDAAGTASLYLTLKPRITDAYRELGYPEGDFDRVLERAMGVLLQAPTLDEKVVLSPQSVTYAYSDPNLESLSPAQKQLLRLGPRNAQAVRGKLEEIAALLKLHPR
jgi:hypothetical protein